MEGAVQILTRVKVEGENDKTAKLELERILKADEKAQSELLLAVSGSAGCFELVRSSKTAKEAWDKLKTKYEPKTISRQIDLNRRFRGMKLHSVSNNPVEEFGLKLERLREKLAELGYRFKIPSLSCRF